VTLLGLSLTNLHDADAPQLALPLEETKASALDAAMDGVRDRFGTAAITRAVLVGRDPGVVMPLLPD
jgi:DNA polymerase-4